VTCQLQSDAKATTATTFLIVLVISKRIERDKTMNLDQLLQTNS
jgi:hypothetical protein